MMTSGNFRTDSGSPGDVIIWQCKDPNCNFRFPELRHFKTNALEEEPANSPICPKCGSPSHRILFPPTITPEQNLPNSSIPLKSKLHLEILLDNIRSTFNVGAMFRTSDGAGIEHIHLCGTTPTPEHPKISKTALGAEFAVPWTFHSNAVAAVEQIKRKNYRIWALECAPQAENIFTVSATTPYDKPILLIVGNEVTGVDPGLIDLCDKTISIPMLGYKRSLNVAIAFGIAVYSICFLRPVFDTIGEDASTT